MAKDKVDVLMVGTGEYTTGYVGGTAADSDKGNSFILARHMNFHHFVSLVLILHITYIETLQVQE